MKKYIPICIIIFAVLLVGAYSKINDVEIKKKKLNPYPIYMRRKVTIGKLD